MTYDEALQEAARRWGEEGYIRQEADTFKVGKERNGIFRVEGAGKSWEEAFRAADQNKPRDRRSRPAG